MKLRRLFACLAMTAAIQISAQTLVENGIAKAEIVISAKAKQTERFAASELQKWLQEITGATLKINEQTGNASSIFLGAEFAKDHFAADLKKLMGNDGYAIRNHSDNIYIFGSQAKGTLNGIYAFLELNTDIIWSRPQEFGTNFTPVKTITVSEKNVLDIPLSTLRGWQICVSPWDKNTELWQIRMATNYAPRVHLRRHRDSYERTINGGMKTILNLGHNLKLYLPESVFPKHPEYFCLIAGKRRANVGKYQVCFSNMDCADLMAEEVVKQAKNAKIPCSAMGFFIQDNWNLCECENCQKRIKLDNGREIAAKDANFNSTRFFIFLNRVAKHVAEKCPGLRIRTFAYFFTIDPPAVKLEDNIEVHFCPAVKDDKKSILTPKNKRWKKRLEGWRKVTDNLIWREYYGCASRYPRPLSDTAAVDMRFLSGKLGFRMFVSEYIPDVPTKHSRCDRSWDVSAMEFWILTKLYWNPWQDVNSLREKYIKRTYGKAAPAMKAFFDIIHSSWYTDPTPSTLSDNPYKSAVHYIVEKGFEKPCRNALKKALTLADKPNVKTNISRTLDAFEDWMKHKQAYVTTKITAPFVPDAANAVKPDSPQWRKASSINGFRIMNRVKKGSQSPTAVRLMHDTKNLYVLYDCKHTLSTPLYTKKNTTSEFFPSGDHIELFISPGKKGADYYHFAADFANARYDSRGYDASWNSSWKAFTSADNDSYHVICIVPLAKVRIDPKKNNTFRANFFRGIHNGHGKRMENSSWGGAPVHQPSGFGNITLGKEK